MKKSFSEKIRDLRGDDTLAVFSNRIGIHLNTYQHYESGARKPNVNVILQIALTCNVTSDWLLGLSDEEDSLRNGKKISRFSTTGVKTRVQELKEYATQTSAKADELLSVIEKMEVVL